MMILHFNDIYYGLMYATDLECSINVGLLRGQNLVFAIICGLHELALVVIKFIRFRKLKFAQGCSTCDNLELGVVEVICK